LNEACFKKHDLQLELTKCSRCRYCGICPFYIEEKWENLTPRGKIYFTKEFMEGKIKKIPNDYVEWIFKCSLCGLCQDVCLQDVDLNQLFKAMRFEIGKQGLLPQPIKGLIKSVGLERNIYNASNNERNNWSWDIEDIL
jgi:Fe-S oxidoreductase